MLKSSLYAFPVLKYLHQFSCSSDQKRLAKYDQCKDFGMLCSFNLGNPFGNGISWTTRGSYRWSRAWCLCRYESLPWTLQHPWSEYSLHWLLLQLCATSLHIVCDVRRLYVTVFVVWRHIGTLCYQDPCRGLVHRADRWKLLWRQHCLCSWHLHRNLQMIKVCVKVALGNGRSMVPW